MGPYDNARYMSWHEGTLPPWGAAGRQLEYFQHQSQVFAENCRGEALVMFGDRLSVDEPEESIWSDVEYPTIRGRLLGARASGVTSLVRVMTDGTRERTI